ncbi:uncharacterized protein LOC112906262 [Agrilus planipennis]|uniref:Uncharacterized protein LOC112906262 n=1 Tax=Agrilus planipennis TaxID=224129 RepID=A0A7F5RIR7_AGRPL|nr:uncharacterized protein LOC112906262 [Agrilus planipennis]
MNYINCYTSRFMSQFTKPIPLSFLKAASPNTEIYEPYGAASRGLVGPSSTGRIDSLVAARFTSPVLVLMVAARMMPYFPGCTSTTRPVFHLRKGRLSSRSSTNCPCSSFGPIETLHLLLWCSWPRYSLDQRVQKCCFN